MILEEAVAKRTRSSNPSGSRDRRAAADNADFIIARARARHATLMSLFGLRTARVAPRAKLAVPASDASMHFSDASRTLSSSHWRRCGANTINVGKFHYVASRSSRAVAFIISDNASLATHSRNFDSPLSSSSLNAHRSRQSRRVSRDLIAGNGNALPRYRRSQRFSDRESFVYHVTNRGKLSRRRGEIARAPRLP